MGVILLRPGMTSYLTMRTRVKIADTKIEKVVSAADHLVRKVEKKVFKHGMPLP